MNQMKWMILPLVLLLASAPAQAQFPEPQLPPDIRFRNIPPDLLQPRPPMPPLNIDQLSPKTQFEWPTWASWQNAGCLFVLSVVIGLYYGRFGPSD
jgi:hypothetical protein